MLKEKLKTSFLVILLLLGNVIITSKTIAMEDLNDHHHVPPRNITFYVQAHQDDWQLFYGDQAWKDIIELDNNSKKNKVVFIYTTAGDNGNKDSELWQGTRLWQRREDGALASIHTVLPDENINKEEIPLIRGHSITKYVIGNTESYFLRLPDGGIDGEGILEVGKSLKKLHEAPTDIYPVDGIGAPYKDWADFGLTLRAILENATPEDLENAAGGNGDARKWINVADFADFNPDKPYEDHSDHHETSMALKDFHDSTKYKFVLYKTYNNSKKTNLSEEDANFKKEMYESYCDKAYKTGETTYWNEGWLETSGGRVYPPNPL